MRTPLALAVLLAPMLVALPGGSAEGEPLLTDAKGDTVFLAAAQGQASPDVPFSGNEQAESTDLLSLAVAESDDDLTLVLAVASLKGTFTGSEYAIGFTWNDRHYRADVLHFVFQSEVFDRAVLQVLEDEDWDDVAPLEMTVSPEEGTLSVVVHKVTLLDTLGNSPNRGDALTAFEVVSDRTQNIELIVSYRMSVVDRMPDEGAGPAFTLALGDEAVGHVRIASQERVRVSNGGATTFVFRVDVHNRGAADDDINFALAEMPVSWEGTVQSPVRVPAGGMKTVNVLASIPFEHKHGGYDSFVVRATSASDAGSFARMKLGVLHTPIPQPAGHHSELFLHGQNLNGAPFDQVFNSAAMWMSTEAQHDADPVEMPANSCPSGGVHEWNIALNPSLQMGLDFDVEKAGTLALTLMSYQKDAGKLGAELFLVPESDDEERYGATVGFDAGSAIRLAKAAPVDVALEPNAALPLSLDLVPEREADYVAFQPRQNLWLQVTLRLENEDFICSGIKTTAALATNDFKLALPLEEYHDRLDGAAEAASSLDLVAEGTVEKTARPGSLMTYAFALTNGGSTVEEVLLELAGNDAKLGVLVPEGAVTLAPGATQRITVGVSVPADSAEGEQLDVLLFAHAKSDPSKSAIARTKTTVALGGAALDDEKQVLQAARDAQKETPGAPLAASLALALALALALRRRVR